MFASISILLLVWFVETPLWVSITCTVLSAVKIIVNAFTVLYEDFKRYLDEEQNKDD